MKKIITAASFFLFPLFIFSQDITGLWTGTMLNDSTKQSLPYEVFIKKEKGKYTGYSQNCFLINGEKYYGIKKIKVNVARDGKIILLDAALIKDNYPFRDKNIKQLNVLDLVGNDAETSLDGLFVTNLTRSYYEVTGKVNLKKVSTFTESSLMQYLQKGGSDNDVTLVK